MIRSQWCSSATRRICCAAFPLDKDRLDENSAFDGHEPRQWREKGSSLNSASLTPKPLASSVYVHIPGSFPLKRSISVTSLFPSPLRGENRCRIQGPADLMPQPPLSGLLRKATEPDSFVLQPSKTQKYENEFRKFTCYCQLAQDNQRSNGPEKDFLTAPFKA
jgi:hypothetical protein